MFNDSSAFPAVKLKPTEPPGTYEKIYCSGMTLRDFFAANALNGIIHRERSPVPEWSVCAEHAYKAADAMIKERDIER